MRKRKDSEASEQLCKAIVEGMQENKAKDIVVLDLRALSSAVCDFFVVCSGESSTQVDGIANTVARYTRKELKEKPWHIEGKSNRYTKYYLIRIWQRKRKKADFQFIGFTLF